MGITISAVGVGSTTTGVSVTSSSGVSMGISTSVVAGGASFESLLLQAPNINEAPMMAHKNIFISSFYCVLVGRLQHESILVQTNFDLNLLLIRRV